MVKNVKIYQFHKYKKSLNFFNDYFLKREKLYLTSF